MTNITQILININIFPKVTTEDGYILSMQRLPASRSGEKANKPPVLIQHGLFCVSFVVADTLSDNYDKENFILYMY
jgi:hypothetical protein